jgi:hypothetical protein
MIIIKNREMLIPDSEQHLGTTYDAETEVRQFKIPRVNAGIDLSDLTFNLDIKYPDATLDTALMTKDVTDTAIILTWDITNRQLSQEGTMFVQMRAYDENVTAKWSTFKAPFYVDGHFQTPQHYSGDLSELEQLEAQFAAIYNSEQIRQANEATRIDNEDARQEAEEARVAAEEQREADLDAAIAEFNQEKSDLYDWMVMSKSWAVGDTGAREGEDTNNSMYWAQRSNASAEAADISAGVAESYADIVIPTFYVDFNTMELMQNETSDRLVFSLSEDKNLMLEIL